MNKLFLYVTLCLLKYAHGRWTVRETANEIPTFPTRRLVRYEPDPPPHTDLVAMARHTLHNADWASIATVSALPAIEGFPFSNLKYITDGFDANSTGIPYFYLSPSDLTAKDLLKNNSATVLVSLDETKYFVGQERNPNDTRCTRLVLTGTMQEVQEGTPEYTFAKAGLFERHPAMAEFPADSDWFVVKLNIAQIAMVDYFGGAKYISVKDYLAYNYTQIARTSRSQISDRQGSVVMNTVNSPYSEIDFDQSHISRLSSVVFNTINSEYCRVKLSLRLCSRTSDDTPSSDISNVRSSVVVNTINRPYGTVQINRRLEPYSSIVINTINCPYSHVSLNIQVC